MKSIIKIFEAISALLLAAMVVLVLLEVLFRYVLKLPLTWSQEFARLFYVYMVYLLFPVLEWKYSQLHVAYFFDKIPIMIRKYVYWATCIIYIVFLVVLALGAALCAKNSGVMIFSSLKWLKMWTMYIPIVIGTIAAILPVFYHMIHYEKALDFYEAENSTEVGK